MRVLVFELGAAECEDRVWVQHQGCECTQSSCGFVLVGVLWAAALDEARGVTGVKVFKLDVATLIVGRCLC